MSDDRTTRLETDKRYPSGLWIGYWMQGFIFRREQMTLTFSGGKVTGDGSDSLGAFRISGCYCVDTGAVSLRKTYDKCPDVSHAGETGEFCIYGTRQIDGIQQEGDWRIWHAQDGYEFVFMEVETDDGPVVVIDESSESGPKEAPK